MAKQLPKDYAILALTAEAERRRKAKGLIRYNYGDLVADTTEEERRQIVERYRKRKRAKDPAAAEVFADPDELPDVPVIRNMDQEAGE